jgi:hypothetical protein
VQFTGLDLGHIESLVQAKLLATVEDRMTSRGELYISPQLGTDLQARAWRMSSDIVEQLVQPFDECCDQLAAFFQEQSAEHSCLLLKDATASEAAGIEGANLGDG